MPLCVVARSAQWSCIQKWHSLPTRNRILTDLDGSWRILTDKWGDSPKSTKWQTPLSLPFPCTVPYWQMIREVNKEKRLKWAKVNQDTTFENVTFTDETTVQMETHRRTCCKWRYKSRYKPKPKAHIWAGISNRGRSRLTIFEGKMNAPLFISILRQSLIPFINDPKHCSKLACKWRWSDRLVADASWIAKLKPNWMHVAWDERIH